MAFYLNKWLAEGIRQACPVRLNPTEFLTVIHLNTRVPAQQPLRTAKRHADTALQRRSPRCDELYAYEGRPSLPPEPLLQARVLMARLTVRGEQLFGEQPGYHLLWLWFLDRACGEGSFDHCLFAKTTNASS